jgi:hypothetical protein
LQQSIRQSAIVFRASFALAVALGAGAQPIAPSAAATSPNPVLAAADDAWARRDERRTGARADRRQISEAVSRYEDAAELPDAVEPRWKLARALFFEARFTGRDRDSQRALLAKARDAGEEAIAILRRRAEAAGRAVPTEPRKVAVALAAERDAAPTYFWTAVAWGEWGLVAPRITAAKKGAATKVRDYASTVIALDAGFEEGGGYRILGRLHHRAPRIPGLTGWVSRVEGIRNLRLAVKTAPRNFVNRHFLAEALGDGGLDAKSEAIRIEKELVADAPSPGHLVEDLAIQEEAKRDLAAWTRKS